MVRNHQMSRTIMQIKSIVAGTAIYDKFIIYSLLIRVLLVSALLFPLGFCLGIYFPLGMQLISQDHKEALPWAWGINSGFSVLGSILSIILAQFFGFNTILMLALVIYLIGLLSFRKMSQVLME